MIVGLDPSMIKIKIVLIYLSTMYFNEMKKFTY